MKVLKKTRTRAMMIAVFSTVKICYYSSSHIQVVLVLVILERERESYVSKAMDELTIKIGESILGISTYLYGSVE